MRQIVIDELTPLERDNLDSYLKRTLIQGFLSGTFWLKIPESLLSTLQLDHRKCQPFWVTALLDKQTLTIELLVRSSTNLHCPCTAYATVSQRDFIFEFVDTMLAEEHITA
ncbi:MAG: hypothetical protein N839_0006250 [Desulfofustis sp. PB-SRB1]|jgi:hypothetical protein|nr:hypothetical protein [Desulfofustis sp. PB-SRB1]MBM1002000.1 hypothetical protein [Desulfofustis sp. PB-SRB1]HBH27599.1 hypothetical protein [Desulfofustis sp.]